MAKLGIKRIYEPALPADGCRVLVDRLWPRGLAREAAAIDHWFKEIGPTNALRTWFGHRPERWAEFSRRYRAELAGDGPAPLVRELVALARKGPLTTQEYDDRQPRDLKGDGRHRPAGAVGRVRSQAGLGQQEQCH